MKKKHSEVYSVGGLVPAVVITVVGVLTSAFALVNAIVQHIR